MLDDRPVASHRDAMRRFDAWQASERRQRQLTAPDGRLEQVEEHGGGRFVYGYDARGDLRHIAEPDGRSTRYDYDAQRRLLQVRHADGTLTRYTYGDQDRLQQIDDRGVVSTFDHDAQGHLTRSRRGNAGACVYRYDAQGRVCEARTAAVSTTQQFDPRGRLQGLQQTLDGVTLAAHFRYDRAGRLVALTLPGSALAIRYRWDARGRPLTVSLGSQEIARFEYLDADKRTRTRLANGLLEETRADPIDARPLWRRLRDGDEIRLERTYTYSDTGQVLADGLRCYGYDGLGRLVSAADMGGDDAWRFAYDARDNREAVETGAGVRRFQYDAMNRLVQIETPVHGPAPCVHDRAGRLLHRPAADGPWSYVYNDAGQLLQVRRRGDTVARFLYDHKDRPVLGRFGTRVERYLYGPDDELLAVTDAEGTPLRLYVRTPLGLLAEVHGALGHGAVYFRHHDDRGTCYRVSDAQGREVARFAYSPFGVPTGHGAFLPGFGGRLWFPDIGLYRFSARWYDPELGRFLTPDAYTGAPDDLRLLHPVWDTRQQAVARAELLPGWLKRPRCRNRYAYCGNDPLNRSDPNGHWSFGGVLLTLLGAIWTLPNTIFGLLVEITCLIGEVIRWLVWLVTGGNVTWATPGIDVAASGRLNAFALVFRGGWLGSFSSLLGITFGNVFFVYDDWEHDPYLTSLPDPLAPPAYGGSVTIPRDQALYEHELRHTNQYGWFGPFFHLGLPVFGVYEWDVILHGYANAWLERDARDHGGL